MLKAVHGYLTQNMGLVAQFPALESEFQVFRTRFESLGFSSQELTKKTTGITADKKEQKRLLANAVAAAAGQVHSFAFTHEDPILIKAMDLSVYDLLRMGADVMAKTCARVIKQIREKNPLLGTHSLTETELGQIEILLADFEGKAPAPRIAVAARSSSLKTVNKDIQYLIRLLEGSVDRLMLRYKFTHPDFYNTYVASREVVDIGSRETKLSGIITDSQTGTGLHKAVITAVEMTNQFRFETTTNVKGLYTLKITEPGSYTLVVSHPLYKEIAEKKLDITLGSQPRENIKLQSVA